MLCFWIGEGFHFLCAFWCLLSTRFLLCAGLKNCLLDASQVSTQMVGSFGYSAPEFALSGIYTVKSDVYSFGVVMLELLTGRKPLDR